MTGALEGHTAIPAVGRFQGTGARRARAIACAALLTVIGADLPGRAQSSDSGLADPRIVSPAGLGPRYTGFLGAGLGLVSKKPSYGISAGEFVLQPRFFLESEFRSNFFRVDDRDGDPTGVLALHVRPGVAMFNPDFTDIALSFGLDLDVFVPFGDENVSDKTNLGGKATVSVAFFPRSAFTLKLHETFERTLWMRPQFDQTANKNYNVAGLDLSFHPGGRALDFSLGYAFGLTRFDDLGRLDSDDHTLRFLASWRFYPMTYTFLEAIWQTSSFNEDVTQDAATQAEGNFVPGSPIKVYAGLSGYITERLALLIRAGYGNSMLDSGEDFESFIGMVQASWRFSERTVLHVGLARDFELAPLGGQVAYLRPYISFTQRFGDLAELTFDLAYDIRRYGRWRPNPNELPNGEVIQPLASALNREEEMLRAGMLIDFDITRLFGATVGYRFEGVFTDFAVVTFNRPAFTGYEDHRLYATLNLRY